LAVRILSHGNRDKATVSVDNLSKLSSEQRVKITLNLVRYGKASKIRRALILKLDGNLRP
jgi:hypothetical protein